MKISLLKKGHNINSKKLKKLMMLTVGTMILMPFLVGCTQKEETEIVDKVRQVSVYTVSDVAHRETLVYNGFINSSQVIPLNFQRDGKVENINVESGQKVLAGDTLMNLTKENESDIAATIYAPIDGVVSQILVDEGNLASKNYPAIILQSSDEKITIGVTGEDFKKIENYGNPSVEVSVNNVTRTAKFKSIALIPDASTMTYSVTIELESSKQTIIGDLAEVRLELSRISGIWLPISYVQNDGEDYVYIVNSDNRVERRNLKLYELNNDLVRVVGVNDGDRIITVGNSFVNEGQLVNAREDVHE
ncbi:biotin/lipoyl-binding protein [Fusibacter bizertensis]|uniref:Biotin/lipoyl-binding protein n=1 Tax=Fusibacter bizertensis TaxID=1488331 RepID=A0ABT6ND19_9FIRM|nr:biotin/lipoyl-binding protein [Fusibacter bizertensis]MDH8678281.1 biotin/lipoyl-binding protein [Fusibacter bizertensis]